MATVSSHILDSILGRSAPGIRVVMHRLSVSGAHENLFDLAADDEGRISVTVDIGQGQQDARYELIFHSADYFQNQHPNPITTGIMDVVVVRMTMPDPNRRYHIPLVLSPHSYTLWWSG